FPMGAIALRGHYRICGSHAYRALPINWTGTCYVGLIRPLFFLMPELEGKGLGIQLYDDLEREKRSIDTSLASRSNQKSGKDEWPPERIIQHYGPATWNPNEVFSGAQEPIYNLNHIIRLQVVFEIITNQTAKALDLLTDQATQIRAAIIQNRVVLNYLLAEEGGICGKLNNSSCCLKIDDNGKVVKEITKGIQKLAHVPVQTWKDINFEWNVWPWLPGPAWVKQTLFYLLLGFILIMMMPCFI
ncbi:ENR1 protein, partial [Anseranas semipalmata]|nr:ENR1 protein [Anseranas semipalmata]